MTIDFLDDDHYAYDDGHTMSVGPTVFPSRDDRGNWRYFNADRRPEPLDDPPVTLFGYPLPGWLAGGIIIGTAGVLCVAAWWAVAEVCAAVIRWLP